MEPRKSTLKGHVQKRLLIGLVVFAPFALTAWILFKIAEFGYSQLTRPLLWLLDTATEHKWSYLRQMIWDPIAGDYLPHVKFVLFFLSVVLTVLMLYTIGFLSTTFFGRRFIQGIERLLRGVPGAEFLYNTFKQVVGMLSQSRSRAFQKVVLVDYPRTGTLCLAFFTGVTVDSETGETLVNVFLPTTPNPTSGFLLLLKPEEVRETNLTISQASRFILSFGVVELDKLKIRRFSIADYFPPGARGAERKSAASPDGSQTPGVAQDPAGTQGG
ncbi:DUF502 domain-containing protein [Candidatus Sumerlaeota bacterium]|nr:DUF502 domain-containing protein [Candidatus Sumerlaeota bacterium]